MPPKVEKIAMACQAMAKLGIAEDRTKAALKKLLKVYLNTWELIEEDKYRVLLEELIPDNNQPNEERVKSKNKKVPSDTTEVIEPPPKRYNTRQWKCQSVAETTRSESSSKRAPPTTMHLKFEEESDVSEEVPLVRKPRKRHISPNEVLVCGNNVNHVPGDCPELERSSNLISEGNFTNIDGCGAGEDVSKYLQVGLLNESNNPSVPDQSQIDVAEVPQQEIISSNSRDRNCDITYIRRRRKDVKINIKDSVLECMQRQVNPSTEIEPMKAMDYLEREPVRDSSSSSNTLLAKEVAELRAEVEAVKAAREKDCINHKALRAQFQAVMQHLSTLVPGFQVP